MATAVIFMAKAVMLGNSSNLMATGNSSNLMATAVNLWQQQ